jgi:NAD-dependent deacetylase
MDSIQEAAEIFRQAERWVAFTGAGVSAESGIPTYRGTGGALWSKYDPAKYASIHSFVSDPSYYWSFFRDERYPMLQSAKPNPAHYVLAHWEGLGKLGCVITQNIDGLHQAAGCKDVVELHGNTQRMYCLGCGRQFSPTEVYQMTEEKLPPPCPDCGGIIRPDVVFFGEMLPRDALDRAYKEAGECDVLLAVGSSLEVYPAADIPRAAVDTGAGLVIINRDPTPFDSMAKVVIGAPAGEVLPKLSEAVGLGLPDELMGNGH